MRTKKALVFGFLGLASAYGALVACGSDSFTGGNDGSDASPTDTDAGDTDATIGGQTCDPTKVSGTDACPPSESNGFFVVAGSDASVADGTRNHPFASIQKGIDAGKATPAKGFVFVCVGDFKEALTLANGISIYAGWGCDGGNWTIVKQHATLHAPTSPAVTGTDLTVKATVDSLDMFAPDGTKDSKSSFGLVLTKASALTIQNSTIQAGNGFDGVDGIEAVGLMQGSSTINGAAAKLGGLRSNCTVLGSPNCDPNGVGGGTSSCVAPTGSSIDVTALNGGPGGGGGSGGACNLSMTGGQCGLGVTCDTCVPPAGSTPTNGGAQPGNASTTQGGVFSPAHIAGLAPTVDGPNGSNGVGGFQGSTFVIQDGIAGSNGKPGTGGGGGAGMAPAVPDPDASSMGKSARGSGGAGGGAGGCPGLAGTAGSAGGASIAVITVDGSVTFNTCVVKAGNGGKAGKGTAGSAPTAGGTAGSNTSTATSNNLLVSFAANGAPGGSSGWSGNGSPGPSYGVVSHNGTPTLIGTSPQFGNGGAGVDVQVAIIGGVSKTIPATPAGQALPTTSF